MKSAFRNSLGLWLRIVILSGWRFVRHVQMAVAFRLLGQSKIGARQVFKFGFSLGVAFDLRFRAEFDRLVPDSYPPQSFPDLFQNTRRHVRVTVAL